jgi:hypothetical protein
MIYILFFWKQDSHPWTKHILSFVLQALGYSMTLGSCSHYIELCPPLFGYSSKHMESLWCLLYHRLMSIFNFLSLIIFVVILSKGIFIQPESAIL